MSTAAVFLSSKPAEEWFGYQILVATAAGKFLNQCQVFRKKHVSREIIISMLMAGLHLSLTVRSSHTLLTQTVLDRTVLS